jgi:hypothetical protein
VFISFIEPKTTFSYNRTVYLQNFVCLQGLSI